MPQQPVHGDRAPGGGSRQSRYSTSSDAEVAALRAARGARWRLRSLLASVPTPQRVAFCGRSAVGEFVPVYVDAGSASYGGIITCGSVWACPVCSAKIRQARAEVVEDRAKRWLRDGRGLLFVTLTMPHTMRDDLGALLDSMTAGWRYVRQHRRFRDAGREVGYVGPLRATEITHGYNGWHPHLHMLLWFERPLTQDEAEAFEQVTFDLWRDAVAHPERGAPSREHGITAIRVGRRQRDAEGLAAYLVKVQDGYDPARPAPGWGAAREMTRGDLKKGRRSHRTPFEIAEAAVRGDKSAAALWRVYCDRTKGRRCLEWGRTLARRLVVDAAADETVAAAAEGVKVGELTRWEWNVVRAYNAGPRLLAAVEDRGRDGLHDVLRALILRVRFDHSRGRAPRARYGGILLPPVLSAA